MALETRIVRVKLSELSGRKVNARYMKGREYRQLVSNLKRDGALTSVPLVARAGEQLEILSGHHRVQAAREAGIEEASVIEITSPLSEEQRTALQLSHNAIVGDDDLAVLETMYRALQLEWKEYSGLTDEAFDLKEVDVNALSIGTPDYQELRILFLPEELELFEANLEEIAKSKAPPRVHMARFEDFDRLFDAVVRAKKLLDVHNSAIALRMLADLALERLEELEAEVSEDDGRADRAG